MTDLQRNALARDITLRLARVGLFDLRVVDKLLLRLEQLRPLSWTRRLATSTQDRDRYFHLPTIAAGRVVTRCNGSWSLDDASEVSIDGPPLHEMCGACAERWARGKDVQLYQLLELARDLATEDLEREALREAARVEMVGGGA